jgi:hypothetical protein
MINISIGKTYMKLIYRKCDINGIIRMAGMIFMTIILVGIKLSEMKVNNWKGREH